MAISTTTSRVNNANVDALVGDAKWATSNLTYSFPTSGGVYGSAYGDGEHTNNFGVLSANQQAAARAAFTQYSSVANLTFTELSGPTAAGADLRLGLTDTVDTAWAYFPSTSPEGGDVWFNRSSGAYNFPQKGNYAYATTLHEIGHALGLEHPHESGIGEAALQSMAQSVMSYRSHDGASTTTGYTNETWGYAQTPMVHDIAALQHMYGANFATQSGDTTYTWSASTGEQFINGVGQGAPGGNRVFQSLWDGGGNDTYDLSNYGGGVQINLMPGAWTTTSSVQRAYLGDGHYAEGNIANTLLSNGDTRSLIENAIGGAGNDQIIGNQTNNVLRGNAGDDTIFSGLGDDIAEGGAGRDQLFGGQGNDKLYGGDHADALYGAAGDDLGVGGLGDDQIYGAAGRDTLHGEGGNDLLSGLRDDDQLFGGDGADTIWSGAGSDVARGGAGNDQIYGGLNDDVLYGETGADTFVFDLTSGVDQVMDFSFAEGDRLSISGQNHMVRDTAEGMAIDLSGGGIVVLHGIDPDQFSQSFFV